MFPSYRNQSVDCRENQLTGFYMMRTLVVKRLKELKKQGMKQTKTTTEKQKSRQALREIFFNH